jgi:hypothetical protein
MFEEVAIKIHRSHMQQAYLFDHIQPGMPAFNTNLFKLVSPDYFCSHVYQAVEATEALTQNESVRSEPLMRAYQKLKPSVKSGQNSKSLVQAALDDATSANKVDYFLLSQQVMTLCSQLDECGIT